MIYERFIGVDGCRGGWFAVSIDRRGDAHWGVFPSFVELWDLWGENALVLIDIPIGLPSSDTLSRLCDTEARRLLSPHRHTSIFSPPSREALAAEDYVDACRRNHETLGRKITLQCWHIARKINEIDAFLNDRPEARGAVRECHPEVCFQSLAGGAPMLRSKKSPEGFQDRMNLLGSLFPLSRSITQRAAGQYTQKTLNRDDIIDALATAVTAFLSKGTLSTLPRHPQRDARGLPMEIVYFHATPGHVSSPHPASPGGEEYTGCEK